jgi:predicted nuclease with TOPRIM domain
MQRDPDADGFPGVLTVGRYQQPPHPADGVPQDAGEATVPFDDDHSVLSSRLFVTGISGSGKSNTVNVLAEEILRAGRPLAILDADGEYYGLREEFEVLLLGEEDCDLRAGPEHGEKLAALALEQHVPLIFDLSSYLDPEAATEAARGFLQALFAKAKTLKEPFPVFVEEAHEYIPQTGSVGPLGEMLFRLAKRGRKHGIGVTAVSQRPAEVAKTFITQAEAVVWHRLTWSNDRSVAGDDLGSRFEAPIKDLGDGEAFVRAEWNPDVQRVQFRRQDTYDGGQTPTLDADATPELKSVDEDLVAQLEDISDRQATLEDENERLRAERDDLQERVETLEAELETRDTAQEEFIDSAEAFAGAVEDALADVAADPGAAGSGGEVQLEVPDQLRARVLEVVQEQAAEQVVTLEAELEDREAALAQKADRIEDLETTVAEKRSRIEDLEAIVEELEQELAELEPLREREQELREAYSRIGEALGESPEDGDDFRERAQREADRRAAATEEYQAVLRGDLSPEDADVPIPETVSPSSTDEAEASTGDGRDAESILEQLDTEEARRRVEQAAKQIRPREDHLWAVLFELAEIADGDHPRFSDEAGERPAAEDLVAHLNVASVSTVYELLGALEVEEGAGMIEKHDHGHKQKSTYSLNVEELDHFSAASKRRERRKQFREQIRAENQS